jgi:hypothetical protein
MTSRDLWIEQQRATYTKWLNTHLAPHDRVTRLPDDLADGVALCHIVATLFSVPLPRGLVLRTDAASGRHQRLANVTLALQMLESVGIATALSPDAVVDGKLVLVLGLVWRLIVATQLRAALHAVDKRSGGALRRSGPAVDTALVGTGVAESEYAVCDASTESAAAGGQLEHADPATRSARESLLRWCRDTAGANVRNFSSDWAAAAPWVSLVDAVLPADRWVWTDRSSIAEAFRAAELELGITPLISVADLADAKRIDERSVMTFVGSFVKAYRKRPLAPATLEPAAFSTLFNAAPESGYGPSGGVTPVASESGYGHSRAEAPADDNDTPDAAGYGPSGAVAPRSGENARAPSSVYAHANAAPAVDYAAGYGAAHGVAPKSKLVEPRYMLTIEDAAAAGYGVSPGVTDPANDAVEYVDVTQKYANYGDIGDLPKSDSTKKDKNKSTTLVSVRPDVSLESSDPRPHFAGSGVTRRGPAQVGTLAFDSSENLNALKTVAAATASSSSSSSSKARSTSSSTSTTAAPAAAASSSTTKVTIAAVTGYKMQPSVTTISYEGGDLVSVEKYRDGRLVDNAVKPKKKDKKNPEPDVHVTINSSPAKSSASSASTSSTSSSNSSSRSQKEEVLLVIKCPGCFARNKYRKGTTRIICHACKTTFRTG